MTLDFRFGYVGEGAHVPEKELTNEDITHLVETSDEWIRRRTGIRTRRVMDGRESILDMACTAARQALDGAGIEPSAIDDVRVAVSTWMRLPSLATQVQKELGIGEASASDVSAGCAGFIYAVEEAWTRMVTERVHYGRSTKALVIGVDGLSHITDWTDRSTCVLLGDGAGAVVLDEVEAGGILATHTDANGEQGHLLYSELPEPDRAPPAPGTPVVVDPGGRQFLRMDGPKVFVAAVETMVRDVKRVLAKHAAATGEVLEVGDIDYVFPHQANLRILEMVARRLKVPADRVYTKGVEKYGNTSAASIPLSYLDVPARHAGKSGTGYEIDVAFGSGFASGALLREVTFG